MDVKGRIRELMDARGWTEYQLKKESGLAASTLANIFHRGTVPGIATLEAICAAFGITLSQFFAGEEEAVALTPSQRELLERWSRLNDDQRRAVLQIIDTM